MMKLLEAQETVSNLKNILTDAYWGDIYYLAQDESLTLESREYEVYIEYLGDLDINAVQRLITLLLGRTVTLAMGTRQIIVG